MFWQESRGKCVIPTGVEGPVVHPGRSKWTPDLSTTLKMTR
jgi:hypothetical protein